MKCVCFGEWNVWALFSVLFRRMTGCPLRTVSILVEEGLARLDATQSVRVETPCGVYAGLKTPTADTVAVVSIVRAGEGSGATLPLLVTGRTSLFVIGRRYAVGSCPAFTPRCCRRQDSHPARRIRPPQASYCEPFSRFCSPVMFSVLMTVSAPHGLQLFYSKLPKGLASKHVILVDPMLGTGGSSSKAIEVRPVSEISSSAPHSSFLSFACKHPYADLGSRWSAAW
jgi:hypothetical protein